jgi:hypothetical protein
VSTRQVRLGPDGEIGPAIDTAAALGDLGLDLAIVSSHRRTTRPCSPRLPMPLPNSADTGIPGMPAGSSVPLGPVSGRTSQATHSLDCAHYRERSVRDK